MTHAVSGVGTNWETITSSADGTKLAALNYGGDIYTSTDSGITWTDQIAAGSRTWWSIASSANGTKLAAVSWPGDIYTSTDSGATWTDRATAGFRTWRSITSSANGTKLAAVVYGGDIFTSTDSGAAWTDRAGAGSRYWLSIASSADGIKLTAVLYGGDIFTSIDSGATWTDRVSSGSRNWYAITSSADGTHLAAAENDGDIYTSTDGGATWTNRTTGTPLSGLYWLSITSSVDGTHLAVTATADALNVNPGYIYTSADSAATWQRQDTAGQDFWGVITSSADGTKLVAVASGPDWGAVGRIHTAVPHLDTVPSITPPPSGNGPIVGTYGKIGGPLPFGIPAPRNQIRYSDGRVIFIDAATSSLPTKIATSTNSNSVFKFPRTLKLGMNGSDVQQLQIFLNTHDFPIAPSGAGSSGHETTHFGPATKLALDKFQAANKITPASGLLGPLTRTAIQNYLPPLQ